MRQLSISTPEFSRPPLNRGRKVSKQALAYITAAVGGVSTFKPTPATKMAPPGLLATCYFPPCHTGPVTGIEGLILVAYFAFVGAAFLLGVMGLAYVVKSCFCTPDDEFMNDSEDTPLLTGRNRRQVIKE